jgi:hypothetical protein
VRAAFDPPFLTADFLSDEELAVLRRGCFKYFERGGDCVRGPVSLLSGFDNTSILPLMSIY